MRVSWYNPRLGGTNCAVFVGGRCLSNMASGLDWRGWFGRAIACPPEWPFWTRVVVAGREWLCLDRGGAIRFQGDIPWIDMLLEAPLYDYGTVVNAEVIRP